MQLFYEFIFVDSVGYEFVICRRFSVGLCVFLSNFVSSYLVLLYLSWRKEKLNSGH